MSEPLLLTKKQAAELLGISYRTLHDLAKSGSIPPSIRLGARGVRYSRKALEEFIERELSAASHGTGEDGDR